MIEMALDHARRGFPVLPLHGVRGGPGQAGCTCGRDNCSSPAKHPRADLARNGLSDATTDPATLQRWWRVAPEANIGLATGSAIVLDVDPRHGGDDSLATLERQHGPLPLTWRAFTGGGGEHVFFAPPPERELRNSTNLVGQGLDVRGVGGYVVGVGSRHVSGRTYEWSVDHHPDEVALAPMPEWLLAILAQPQAGQAATVESWRRLTTDGVEHGGRNTAIAKLSGHLLRRYVDPLVTLELMQGFNAMRCRPPLSEAEVTKTVASICRKEQQRQEALNGGR